MRWRRCMHLLLAGFLALAQAGAAAHAVAHFADGGERQDHGTTATDVCDLCAAYSATGHALGADPLLPPCMAVDVHDLDSDTPAPASLAPPAQRARGPPSHA